MPLPSELPIDELEARLAFARAPGVGPALIHQCLVQYGSIKALINYDYAELPPGLNEILTKLDWPGAQKDLAWCDNAQHSLILQESASFPGLLKEISHCPPWLFVKGDAHVLQQPQVAFVGSRHASYYGLKVTRFLIEGLAAQGLAITSGLALGIDAASHEAALAFGSKTIAVQALGLDQVYPKRHHTLAENILEQGGALISEFPVGVPPLAIHFPRRNRLISGLSHAVVVVEAQLPSGSLITAQYALEQGREVFAVPGSIFQTTAKGCHALIQQGAQCITSAEEILTALALPLQKTHAEISKAIVSHDLSDLQLQVWQVLGDMPLCFDEIHTQLDISTQELLMTLTQLVLMEIVVESWQGYVRK